jgi:lambda family phage tail tape measure protein
MAVIEDFILRFKTVGTAGIKQAGDAVSGLKDDVSNFAQIGGPLGNTLNGIVTKLGPVGLAAAAAGAAFAALGGSALRLANDLEDIAGATGIATGNVNSFAGSLIAAGGKMEDAGQILGKLNQSINEAAGGNENLQKAFQNLGVYVTDAAGAIRPTTDILKDITDKFNSGELSAAQFNAAIDIMGKGINRLELQKLSAADNPAITEATKNLDKFNDEIDKVYKSIKDNLIISFGALAKAVNEGGIGAGLAKITEELGYLAAEILNLPTDAIAGFLNFFGADIKNPVGLGTPLKALTDKAKEDRLKFQAEQVKLKEARAAADKALQKGPASTTVSGPAGGGFGATPEADLKAAAEYEKRIATVRADIKKQEQLKSNSERLSAALMFADKQSAIEEKANSDVAAINITTAAEIEKAKTQIFAQERLSRQQKEQEFTLKETELKLKAETDIAKIRQNTTDALMRERERIEDIIRTSKARVQEEEAVNEVLSRRNNFLNTNISATDLERERAQKLFDIEEERLKVLRQIRQVKDLPEADRAAREKEVNTIYDQRLEQTKRQNEQDIKNSQDFAAGFKKAYNTYAENARNSFETAGRIFNKITQGMEDSIVNFVKTGKFEFQDFLNTILEELLRSQIRQAIAQTFGGFSGNSGGGGLGQLLGFANGGIIPTNRPVVVGERGPEILIGASGGRVVPNNQIGGGGSVTYNINAVDSQSFKQLIARDPGFIHAVAMQGAKSTPGRR